MGHLLERIQETISQTRIESNPSTEHLSIGSDNEGY
jgi:hypothetical protein